MPRNRKMTRRARRAVDIQEMMEQRIRALVRKQSERIKARLKIGVERNTLDRQAVEAARKARRDLPLQTNMQAALAQVQMSEMPGLMCFKGEE